MMEMYFKYRIKMPYKSAAITDRPNVNSEIENWNTADVK